MHDCIRAYTRKRNLDLATVGQIALDEFCARVHGAAMAFAKIIEDGSLIAFIKKQFCTDAPDISGAANDENFHALGKCSAPCANQSDRRRAACCATVFPL